MSTPCENCGSHIRVCADCDFNKGKYIKIPDNATNGQVIKAIFPHGKIWKSDSYMCLLIYGQGDAQMIDTDWWNAPYQKGGK